MASVNKASLRQEFDSLNGQFEQLCAAGKMAQESKTLFQAAPVRNVVAMKDNTLRTVEEQL